MSESKKYYWLKLHRDFFKRHDVKIIKDQKNGAEYLLFYLNLLTESIDHEGMLRFSELIPYDEKMLSTITDTNIDIVRSAVTLFTNLGLIEIFDDKTIFMTEVQKMIGAETEYAIKKRAYREKIKSEEDVLIEADIVETKKDNVRQEKEIEKEIELDKEIKKTSKEIPPKGVSDSFTTKEMHSMFKDFALGDKSLYNELVEFDKMRKKLRKPMTKRAVELMLNRLHRLSKEHNLPSIAFLQQSILKAWTDVYPIRKDFVDYLQNNKPNDIEVDWLEDYIKNMN